MGANLIKGVTITSLVNVIFGIFLKYFDKKISQNLKYFKILLYLIFYYIFAKKRNSNSNNCISSLII
jgi:hypothetical protein